MDRYPVLILGLIVFGVASVIALFIDFEASNIIMSIGYFSTFIYFLFRSEAIPTRYVNAPAVDFYRRSRFNTFNYILLSYAVVTALIFALVSINTSLPYGLFALVFWVFIILFIEFYLQRFPELTQTRNMMIDYIQERLAQNNIQIDENFLTELVVLVQENQLTQVKEMLVKNQLNENISEQIVQWYNAYVEGMREDLSAEEIEELN